MSDEKRPVRWYVVKSRDEDGADKPEVSALTRERAIAAGRVMYQGLAFGVWRGEAVTETEVAAWMLGVIESAIDIGDLERDLEIGSDDPILEIVEDDRAPIVSAIARIIKKRRLLTPYYRWVDYEDIPAVEAPLAADPALDRQYRLVPGEKCYRCGTADVPLAGPGDYDQYVCRPCVLGGAP